jgi:hypothetical protein
LFFLFVQGDYALLVVQLCRTAVPLRLFLSKFCDTICRPKPSLWVRGRQSLPTALLIYEISDLHQEERPNPAANSDAAVASHRRSSDKRL